ncbi:MAG: hypothetical protein OXC72_00540 [Roseovarius sp.]|nr:hypothetical protein [Roseovarius sp.]MCY4314955.1 hypothetical protein [Roseovarius sp.]
MRKMERRLWGVPALVADVLEKRGEPVLTAWDLYALIRKSYHDREREIPASRSLHKVRGSLEKAGVVAPDRDYKTHYRVINVTDLPADDIICLIDRFCHISHLSAMQNWGLTNRKSHELIITRPDDLAVKAMLSDIMKQEAKSAPWHHRDSAPSSSPFHLGNIRHPGHVRRRAIKVRKSRRAGQSLKNRNGFSRIATIGQTFLDMLKQPALCGGMAHVIDVWSEHAITHLDQIIETVSSANSAVKCRAGYIIDERLGVNDSRVEAWHACAQRGGSSRLDPRRPYVPRWSDKWMISINA